MYGLGIDSGSTTTKGVLFNENGIVEKMIMPTGVNPRKTIKELYDTLKGDREVFTVTTGYGRNLLEESDKKITEITCHGKGATFLGGDISGVIDIGGQDSKAILLDRYNSVQDFLMNDKCAAGTGRFIEVIMRIFQQDMESLDDFIGGHEPVKITSMCTVFAESEVVSMLGQGIDANSIAMGVIDSICQRTANFVSKLPMENKVFFSGGLADSEVIRQTLEDKLGMEVIVSELSQFTGAIGAAMIAYDKAK